MCTSTWPVFYFCMVRKFRPNYWLLLELYALTLVTRSYAFLLRDMANGRPQNTTQHIAIQPESCAPSDFELWIGKFVVCYCLLIIPLSAQASARFKCQYAVNLASYTWRTDMTQLKEHPPPLFGILVRCSTHGHTCTLISTCTYTSACTNNYNTGFIFIHGRALLSPSLTPFQQLSYCWLHPEFQQHQMQRSLQSRGLLPTVGAQYHQWWLLADPGPAAARHRLEWWNREQKNLPLCPDWREIWCATICTF